MSDQWEMYFSSVDEQPAAILVDIGVGETAPDPDRPILLWVWLQMKSPDDNGFASEQEESKLTRIEDTFIDAVELTTGAALVGRVTTCGRREFYFYAKSEEGFDDTIAEAMQQFDQYEYETGSQTDDEWAQYLEVLYPNAEDAQQIFNRQTIDNLVEAGDTLTTPREVNHFVNFRSTDDRSRFVAAAASTRFEITGEDFDDDPDCELPYSVSLSHVSPVDEETIDEVTFELFDLAQEFDGEYEGWETRVVLD